VSNLFPPLEALALLRLRREQAGSLYQAGDTKYRFLARSGAGPGR
jgi:hypothetical protein